MISRWSLVHLKQYIYMYVCMHACMYVYMYVQFRKMYTPNVMQWNYVCIHMEKKSTP